MGRLLRPRATPQVPDAFIPPADRLVGNTDGLLGFRVPCLIVSPFARRRVSSTIFDHNSILKLIEWRWALEPLTTRDASANNLAEALDFSSVETKPKRYKVPTGPFGAAARPRWRPPTTRTSGKSCARWR